MPCGSDDRTHRYKVEESILLLDGLACRYKDMKEGSRQLLELNLPGDFIDLHGLLLKRLDHSIGRLTPCTLANVPHACLRRITETMLHLSSRLWFQTALDAAIHREWVMTLSQRSAFSRVAQLFCELQVRLSRGWVDSDDLKDLRREAEFNPTYLSLDHRSR